MTTTTQQTAARRWVLPFLAAMVAALAAILGLTTAPASAADVAENRVGAFNVAAEPAIGPPQHVSAGQSRDAAAENQPGFVVASGVAAKTAARTPGVIRVGELKLPGVPKGVTGTPTSSGKGLQYTIPRGRPELDPRVSSIRVMDPVTTGTYQYPNGYVTYMNGRQQAVNPLTGRTLQPSDPLWHIELP